MVKRKVHVKDGPHPIDLHIGRRVRALRHERGLTQHLLGERIGVSYQQIQKYETGTNRVSASMLFEIARVLKTDITTLFEGCMDGVASKPAIRRGLD